MALEYVTTEWLARSVPIDLRSVLKRPRSWDKFSTTDLLKLHSPLLYISSINEICYIIILLRQITGRWISHNRRRDMVSVAPHGGHCHFNSFQLPYGSPHSKSRLMTTVEIDFIAGRPFNELHRVTHTKDKIRIYQYCGEFLSLILNLSHKFICFEASRQGNKSTTLLGNNLFIMQSLACYKI